MDCHAQRSSSKILKEAKAIFSGTEQQYRDKLLAVGILLHEYILAFLSEGDGLNHNKRQAAQITREKAVFNIEQEMEAATGRVAHLIGAAMVVELLSEGNIGDLTHAAISRFHVFIARKSWAKQIKFKAISGPSITECEEWIIKPGCEQIAKRLFRTAVNEKWNERRVTAECLKYPKMRSAGETKAKLHESGPTTETDRDARETILSQVKAASPGDVAELCMDLVRQSEEPYAVAIRLIGMLQAIKPKKRPMAV